MNYRHVVYHCADAPEPMRFIAYTLAPGAKKGTEHRLSVAFPAATAEAALAAAEAHWQGEIDKHHRREAAAKKRGEALEAWRASRATGVATLIGG